MPQKQGGRQRVSLACEECRAKRTRCDGAQPACGSCTKKGTSCEYKHEENKRKPPSKRYVESLQAHIALLEERLVALGQTVTRLETGQPNTQLEEEIPNPATATGESICPSRDPIEELTRLAGRLNIGEDGRLRYFGAQSNYHLLHGPLYNETTHSVDNCQSIGLESATLLGKSVHVPRELQDHLLDLYWRWHNPGLYIIHRESFMRDYERGGVGAFCSPLLLSAVFALSSRFSDRLDVRSDPADPHSAGNHFAEQAKILLMYECEAPTTTTVQAASLLSLRWMSENKESLGWLYMGMATRMAYNLGLNLDCSEWVAAGKITEQDAQVRRITWWGCYKLDKLYCLGLGRPGTTRPSDITCLKPTIEQDVEFEPWVPPAKTGHDASELGAHSRTISAMRYSCDHLSLLSTPLETLYAPGNKLTQSEAERIVAETDVAFSAFYHGLPSHLLLPSSPRVAALPHIYQLHIQFHVFQIQLHRPLIRRSKSGERGNLSGHPDPHLKACRKSAAAMSRILRMYQYHYTLRFAPVVTVVNTFTAAVISLMDAASADVEIQRSALRNLRICVPALEDMALAWMWSRRALRAISLLAHEWLVPQAVMLSLNKTCSVPLPALPSSTGALEHTERFTAPVIPSDSYPLEQNTGPTPGREAGDHPPDVPIIPLDERGCIPGVEGGWLFDLDAMGQINGVIDSTTFSDPWLWNALTQDPSSEEQGSSFSDGPHDLWPGQYPQPWW
ncbi:fungal-specific transcription factor domain-containing protein [Aspergillus multicolor]|uniref:transcription factor domain-containing protein n=1 Tax=Aspergillus multicolor TaxID=41759 RepID=UPI003CCE2D06